MFPLHGVLREIRSLNMPASVQKNPLKSTHVLSLDRKKGMIIEAEKHTLYLYHHRATRQAYLLQTKIMIKSGLEYN